MGGAQRKGWRRGGKRDRRSSWTQALEEQNNGGEGGGSIEYPDKQPQGCGGLAISMEQHWKRLSKRKKESLKNQERRGRNREPFQVENYPKKGGGYTIYCRGEGSYGG